MKRKVSEKKLLASVICFAVGLVVFFHTNILAAPVRVSEIGILINGASAGLLFCGVLLFKKSFARV